MNSNLTAMAAGLLRIRAMQHGERMSLVQATLKRGFSKKKPNIKPDSHLNTGVRADGMEFGRYGLRRVDYSKPPPVWPMPPHPPEPKGLRRFVFPVSLGISLALFAYIYFNPEDDIQEYWRAVDSGNVPLDMDDDDDDDDDEDDDDEDDDDEDE